MTDKTTISITTDTKSELNSLGYKDESYDTIIKRNIDFSKKFNNEREFHEWFRYNFGLFGFDDVIKESFHSCPDFIVSKGDKQVRIELEIYSSGFVRHKHNPDSVDLVICLLKDRELPIEVLELNVFEFTNIKYHINASNSSIKMFNALRKLLSKSNGNNSRTISHEEAMKYLITNNPFSKEIEQYVKTDEATLNTLIKVKK